MKMQILAIGLLVLAAYVGGILARKLHIGEVVGQILGGIFVGPHFLEIVHRVLEHYSGLKGMSFLKPVYTFFNTSFHAYAEIFESFHFFVFLLLGLVAFSLGEELHIDRLKLVGIKASIICILQALLTWVMISMGFWLAFDFDIIHSMLIGSIGIATAPALTFILMSRLNIEGRLKNILANIVVLDDIIEVIFFSVFLGIAVAMKRGVELSLLSLGGHVLEELIMALLVGAGVFGILKLTVKKRLPTDDRDASKESFLSTILSEHPTPSVEMLLIMIGVVAIGIATAIHFNLPFLITAVVAGFLISNFHSHAIFDSLRIGNVMPIFNLLFFAIIGASVQIEGFSSDSLVFVMGYLGLRLAGKLIGNWAGCKITGQDPKITACLPRLMLPQAGMAAVEVILVATMLKGYGGEEIFNTIIPALVLFEVGGAYISEKTLLKWKSWTTGERESLATKTRRPDDYSLYELIGSRVTEVIADSSRGVISEMAKVLKAEGIISEEGIVTQRVFEREKLASTGAGDGVAFPHCKVSGLKKVVVVCGLLERPVDWNSLDRRPVDFVFLLVSPAEYPDQHLMALRAISVALRKSGLRDGLRDALKSKTTEAFLREELS
ncbi:MAG: cation:proton antiporter [Candidatus Coatesbacteria bacterium]|nr:cation:proton antiporter [Candidatus Coatesbacteria bacterium]